MNLVAVAEEIQHRIIHIFGRDMHGRRATNGGNARLDFDPHFRDYVWFYEVGFNSSLFYSVPRYQELMDFEISSLRYSTSTPTMAEDSARRTKLVGPVLWRTIFSRAESIVVCRRHPEVNLCFALKKTVSWTG